MSHHNDAAGRVLRRLRQERALTLHAAARLLSTSAPVLSRKERGQERIDRRDVAAAVRAYQLSTWESYELWTTAGFVAEPAVEPPRPQTLQPLADALLPGLPLPALLVDALGYVRAWNEGAEAIWRPGHAEQLHLVGQIFAPAVRARLGDRWTRYAGHMLALFYQKTLPLSRDPAFLSLLAALERQHGADFTQLWQAVRAGGFAPARLPAEEAAAAVVPYDSPVGVIEYVALQSRAPFPQPYDLVVYVPFGDENNERYRRLARLMPPNRAYVRL